jgi:dihydrofolate reductase
VGKIIATFAMSLDGFIADAQDGVWSLFGWLTSGDTPLQVPGVDRAFKTSAASAAHYQELLDTTGAEVTGRRDFDISRAWGGKHPFGIPAFIVTHSPPQEWVYEGSPFTFVTDGVESAVEQARKAAGDRNVIVNGSKIAQQCLNAGLIDEVQIDLAPILLGSGIRLFERAAPIELETTSVVDAPGVTHLKFRVVK